MVRMMTKGDYQKAKEAKRAETKRQAESWIDQANSDEPEDLPRSGAESAKPSNLVRTNIRLHPDILTKIAERAIEDRKKEADVLRDFILKGMRADGIKI